MRFRISPSGHDPRQIDLFAVLALVVIIIGVWRYYEDISASPPSTTSYIVPSQHVHW
ncbi:hypothetical protein [Bradyrhizobium sp. STM 3557]|uniref:hypothetical protein n=1 Tax=Bradyrhizobium sp. STM 3557 TaxID=578920 RepID=UPI00388E2E66